MASPEAQRERRIAAIMAPSAFRGGRTARAAAASHSRAVHPEPTPTPKAKRRPVIDSDSDDDYFFSSKPKRESERDRVVHRSARGAAPDDGDDDDDDDRGEQGQRQGEEDHDAQIQTREEPPLRALRCSLGFADVRRPQDAHLLERCERQVTQFRSTVLARRGPACRSV